MGQHIQVAPSQENTMEYYTTSTPLSQRQMRHTRQGEEQTMTTSMEEPYHAELLAAIRGCRVAIEDKIETVALEGLQTDLRKVSDKVKVVEGFIVELQMEVDTLHKQLAQDIEKSRTLEARLEDAKGSSRWNNVCLLGFPECAEGASTEAFVEQ
ncbi:hypothetical protein NDU88_003086 [Pleurodeles waltl]|uniref:Uncharacterized protein n=1 Tax=Pleurodeles waltl TaxID=8319 RepID=A0AAV7MPI9_PLEWA|nr:hypothetical protein NDU88_003086 [Pleurodeles waltl]